MTPSLQNLNAKLSPRPRPTSPAVAAANRHLARSAAPSPSSRRARIAGRGDNYRGGYCITV